MDLVDELIAAAAAAAGTADDRGETTVYRAGRVVTGAAGSALIVTVDGVDVEWPAVQRLASYTPAAGDRVACIRFGHRYLIIGRIADTP